VTAVLYVASTAVDTDFTAALCDVLPDGRAASLCEGICRTRFRHSANAQPWLAVRGVHMSADAEYRGMTSPEMMVPGSCYEIRIDLWDTAICFGVGHRIRLDISSSNFPRCACPQYY
jgi:putative CocE/NonD family hydrolase